jgi:hypothetical protein
VSLRCDFHAVVLSHLPTQESKLGEPDPRWDAILGGRTGPDNWNWYGRAAGTTCIVTVNGFAAQTPGFPENMVVREPTPNGGGTRMIQAQIKGAEARGWLRTPVRGQLPNFRPGDIFNINHATSDGTDGTHEGVVVCVTPSADGQSLIVETADGGQGSRTAQFASRNKRTFRLSDGPNPVVVQSPSGPGWLDRWIALGGDEDDGPCGLAVAGDAVAVDSGSGFSAGALVLAGAGALVIAMALWAGSSPTPPPVIRLEQWLAMHGLLHGKMQ